MGRILITGTSSGFGLLTALAFARTGRQVVATMRDTSRAGPLREAAAAEGLDVEVRPLDVLDEASVRAAVAEVEAGGPIDVVVNNAGASISGPIEELDDDEVSAQFDLNVRGVLRVIRATLPALRSRGAGTIVNISSGTAVGLVPFYGVYPTTKHALEGLSESLAAEVAPFGVRVILVEPLAYPTGFAGNTRQARRHDESSPYAAAVAAGRAAMRAGFEANGPGDPREVADEIVAAVDDPTPRFRYLIGPAWQKARIRAAWQGRVDSLARALDPPA